MKEQGEHGSGPVGLSLSKQDLCREWLWEPGPAASCLGQQSSSRPSNSLCLSWNCKIANNSHGWLGPNLALPSHPQLFLSAKCSFCRHVFLWFFTPTPYSSSLSISCPMMIPNTLMIRYCPVTKVANPTSLKGPQSSFTSITLKNIVEARNPLKC